MRGSFLQWRRQAMRRDGPLTIYFEDSFYLSTKSENLQVCRYQKENFTLQLWAIGMEMSGRALQSFPSFLWLSTLTFLLHVRREKYIGTFPPSRPSSARNRWDVDEQRNMILFKTSSSYTCVWFKIKLITLVLVKSFLLLHFIFLPFILHFQ